MVARSARSDQLCRALVVRPAGGVRRGWLKRRRVVPVRRLRSGVAVHRSCAGNSPDPACLMRTRAFAARSSSAGARRAQTRHRRRGIAGELCGGCAEGYYRVRRTSRARKTGALVSIIIPTCAAGGLIETCIETLRANDRLPEFRDHLHREHPAERPEWRRLAAPQRRPGDLDRRAVQLVALQQPRGGRSATANTCCSSTTISRSSTPTGSTRCSPRRSGRRSASSGRACFIPTAGCSTPACSWRRDGAGPPCLPLTRGRRCPAISVWR